MGLLLESTNDPIQVEKQGNTIVDRRLSTIKYSDGRLLRRRNSESLLTGRRRDDKVLESASSEKLSSGTGVEKYRRRLRAKTLALLESRILLDTKLSKKYQSQLESEGKIWNEVVSALTLRPFWDSYNRKGQLGRLKLQIEATLYKRSVIILKSIKHILCEEKDGELDIDHILENDTLYRTLQLQRHWLERLSTWRNKSMLSKSMLSSSSLPSKSMLSKSMSSKSLSSKSLSSSSSSSKSMLSSSEIQYFSPRHNTEVQHQLIDDTFLCYLREYGEDRNIQLSSNDLPLSSQIHFEWFLVQLDFHKKDFGLALEKICATLLENITCENFKEQENLHSLTPNMICHQTVRYILQEYSLPDDLLCPLERFVERMIYSRIAAVCYIQQHEEINRKNLIWQKKAHIMKSVALYQLDLPKSIELNKRLENPMEDLFPRSLIAFSLLPSIIPTDVLASTMQAVKEMHEEAAVLFNIPTSSMSADHLLPVLVYILSRSTVPYIHSQLYLLENFALDDHTGGSEEAYYIACIRAAVTYVEAYDPHIDPHTEKVQDKTKKDIDMETSIPNAKEEKSVK